MPISNGYVAEVTMFGRLDNSTILNVFHYKYSGPTIPDTDYVAEMGQVIQSFLTTVWGTVALDKIRARLSDQYTLQKVRAQVVAPLRRFYVDTETNQTGNVAGVCLPSNTAIACQLKVNRVGRGVSGYKRFAGIPGNAVVGSEVDPVEEPAWRTAVATLQNNLSAGAVGGLWSPCVWDRTLGGVPQDIREVELKTNVRIQYSRTFRVGI